MNTTNIIFDNAGFQYTVTEQPTESMQNYVTFNEGKPVVVRNGEPINESRFSDGLGKLAIVVDCKDIDNELMDVVKRMEVDLITCVNGEIHCPISATILYDRAGCSYVLTNQPKEAMQNYVTFKDGKPVVIRNGEPVASSFFTDGKGNWAKLLDCSNPEKVAKALKKAENPIIAVKDGEIICQLVPLTGILWHDEKGRKFWLITKYERAELEADGLGYLTAESEGTYETLKFIAHDGEKEVPVPHFLYNEKNRKFQVGVNYKKMAYDQMTKTGNAAIAIKNANKFVYARRADTGEFMMAHTNGAFEAAEFAKEGTWNVEYTTGGGSWGVSAEEFFQRYEFHTIDEQGRVICRPKSAEYVWVHLFGDFIGCIPQWGDSLVAMSNPQVNITNPDDVYACSYIEFYGREDMDGAYVVLRELYLGAPEHVILQFTETLAGYVETTFGIPKSAITASNLATFIRESLGIPVELEVLQARISKAVA